MGHGAGRRAGSQEGWSSPGHVEVPSLCTRQHNRVFSGTMSLLSDARAEKDITFKRKSSNSGK